MSYEPYDKASASPGTLPAIELLIAARNMAQQGFAHSPVASRINDALDILHKLAAPSKEAGAEPYAWGYTNITGDKGVSLQRWPHVVPGYTEHALIANPPGDQRQEGNVPRAALQSLHDAFVRAGGAETVARHGVERGRDEWRDDVQRALIAVEQYLHPERFDSFPTGKPASPPPEAAAPGFDAWWQAIGTGLYERTATVHHVAETAWLAALSARAPNKAAPAIDAMVNRFLCWKLPKDFSPDAGISFTPYDPPEHPHMRDLCWPVGTNLLTADQARAMFTHCLAAPPFPPGVEPPLPGACPLRHRLSGVLRRTGASTQSCRTPGAHRTTRNRSTAMTDDPKATALAAIGAALDRGKLMASTLDNLAADLGAAGDAIAQLLPAGVGATRLRVLDAQAGASDATAAIQTQVDAVGDAGGVLYLGAGLWPINTSAVLLRAGLWLVLHPDAVLAKIANGLPRTYVLWGKAISDGGVLGGQIRGDRLTHDYTTVAGTHEWGHGIMLAACQRMLLRDIDIQNCTGDGASVGGALISVLNVSSQYNRRQGLTIGGGSDILVRGGVFSYSGKLGTNAGAKPMAGIDMEPDGGSLSGVLIDGVTASHNGTTGILAVSNTTAKAVLSDITIRNCRAEFQPNGVQAQGSGGPITGFKVIRNQLGQHTGNAVKFEGNTSGSIGSTDKADANTIAGTSTTRTPFALLGTDPRTRYDIQLLSPAAAAVGWNTYIPAPLP